MHTVWLLIGAAVLKQLCFKKAMQHKALVAEVACDAKGKGMSPIMGVLFDELCRHTFSSM